MKKGIFIFAICVCVSVFCYSGYRIYEYLNENQESAAVYSGLDKYVSISGATEITTNHETPVTQDDPEPDDAPQTMLLWPEVDFDALQEINSDIVGWIYIEGTSINYPIVQGEDNSYYLKHLFSKEWNSSGCIFMDSRNSLDFSDRHTIIYGHHMKNGTMFSDLDGYKTQEFYEQHPTVMLMTPRAKYLVELFAGYVSDLDSSAWDLGFTASGYTDWLKDTKAHSCFSSPVEPEVSDCVVTLSTCSYEFSDARFVVVGVAREINN